MLAGWIVLPAAERLALSRPVGRDLPPCPQELAAHSLEPINADSPMASAPLLPALAQEPAALAPIATVSVLLALRPVARQLRQAMENLASGEAEGLDSLLQRTGSAIVFRGHPSAARHLEERLRSTGLTTSVNLLAQQPITA